MRPETMLAICKIIVSLLMMLRVCLKSHVSRKCSDFERKILKSEADYRDNPTSFERFSAEIWIFYEASACFCLNVRGEI